MGRPGMAVRLSDPLGGPEILLMEIRMPVMDEVVATAS